MQQNYFCLVFIINIHRTVAMTLFPKNKKTLTYTLQRELYQLHYRRIYNTCLRIIGNRMDAEEAMHDVFLKLFDRLDDLQNEKAFYSWSRIVAIRTSIDRIRKKRLVFEQIDLLPIATEVSNESSNESMELSVEAIKCQLNLLPDGYRAVVSMRLFEECSFEEIAKILKIKESTVRSQYTRGREKLSQMLQSVVLNQ